MKWFSNFKKAGNYNNKFGLSEIGIERHEVHHCGFDDQIKW
jgi:hypothetical protein